MADLVNYDLRTTIAGGLGDVALACNTIQATAAASPYTVPLNLDALSYTYAIAKALGQLQAKAIADHHLNYSGQPNALSIDIDTDPITTLDRFGKAVQQLQAAYSI